MKHGPWILSLACCGALAAGCFNVIEPTSPRGAGLQSAVQASAGPGDRTAVDLSSPDGGFYPLEIGNRWHSLDDNIVQLIPDQGAAEPPFEDHGTIAVEMACTEAVGDRSYAVEHSTYASPIGGAETWVRYRQDHSGLYELDSDISTPGTCAGASAALRSGSTSPMSLAERVMAARPEYRLYRSSFEQLERKRSALMTALRGGARPTAQQALLPGELTRLQYPLHAGEQWMIRVDPPFVATVEGSDLLELPAGRFKGYRIHIEAPGLFGSNDRVFTWYDRHGALQLLAHLEGQWVDADGNILGKIVNDETRKLDDLTLVGPGRF